MSAERSMKEQTCMCFRKEMNLRSFCNIVCPPPADFFPHLLEGLYKTPCLLISAKRSEMISCSCIYNDSVIESILGVGMKEENKTPNHQTDLTSQENHGEGKSNGKSKKQYKNSEYFLFICCLLFLFMCKLTPSIYF